MRTMSGARGEIEIEASEAEEGNRGVEEEHTGLKAPGNVIGSAIWGGANGSTHHGSLHSCLTN